MNNGARFEKASDTDGVQIVHDSACAAKTPAPVDLSAERRRSKMCLLFKSKIGN
jgi:hypothetical protein